MKDSELVSVSWLMFFALFTAAAFFFTDRKHNQAWIERMGAYIFISIALASYSGAMAGKFFSTSFGLLWYSGSTINTSVAVLSIILSWVLFACSVEWLLALFVLSLLAGGAGWLLVGFII